MTREQENGRRRQFREQGFTDGAAGRKPRWDDSEYQRAYERGQTERRRRARTR